MKALWLISLEKYVPYDPSIHLKEAFKFLYWEEKDEKNEETLLVGWPEEFIANISELTHLDIFCLEIAPKREPDGAGIVLQRKIVDWKSGTLDIETPGHLRPRILELLGAEDYFVHNNTKVRKMCQNND